MDAVHRRVSRPEFVSAMEQACERPAAMPLVEAVFKYLRVRLRNRALRQQAIDDARKPQLPDGHGDGSGDGEGDGSGQLELWSPSRQQAPGSLPVTPQSHAPCSSAIASKSGRLLRYSSSAHVVFSARQYSHVWPRQRLAHLEGMALRVRKVTAQEEGDFFVQ